MESTRIALRYFCCRGRGQALRYALVDAGLEFEDVIFQADESWPSHKASEDVSGPFSSLPVLAWGEHRVAQTLAIASYLSRQLGHYEARDAQAIARLESVTSGARKPCLGG